MQVRRRILITGMLIFAFGAPNAYSQVSCKSVFVTDINPIKTAEALVASLKKADPSVAAGSGRGIKTEIFMRMAIQGSDYLSSIDQHGVQNQYITRATSGMPALKHRYYTERNLIGKHGENLKFDLLPKYGYLNVIGRPFNTEEYRASQYGKIIFKLKDNVRKRTTFVVGDSLFHKNPTQALSELPGVEQAMENTPSYYEAQIWGPLTLDEVQDVIVDTQYEPLKPELLTQLKKLSDKYGFKIFTAKYTINFNQSSSLDRKLIYQPAAEIKSPAFKPLSLEQIKARLKDMNKESTSGNDIETCILLHELTTALGASAEPLLLEYASDPSQPVREAVALNLADIGATSALRISDIDSEVKSVASDKLNPKPLRLDVNFDPMDFTEEEIAEALNQINSESPQARVRLSQLLARFPDSQPLQDEIADWLIKHPSDKNDSILQTMVSGHPRNDNLASLAEKLDQFPQSTSQMLAALLVRSTPETQKSLLNSIEGHSFNWDTTLILKKLCSASDLEVAIRALQILAKANPAILEPVFIRKLLADKSTKKQLQGLMLLSATGLKDAQAVKMLQQHGLAFHQNLVQAVRDGLNLRHNKVDPELLNAIQKSDDSTWKTFEFITDHNENANHDWIEQQLSNLSSNRHSDGRANNSTTSPVSYFVSPVRLIRYIAFKWNSPARIPTLLNMAKNQELEISREVAIQSLGLINTTESRNALLTLTHSQLKDVRHGANSALKPMEVL